MSGERKQVSALFSGPQNGKSRARRRRMAASCFKAPTACHLHSPISGELTISGMYPCKQEPHLFAQRTRAFLAPVTLRKRPLFLAHQPRHPVAHMVATGPRPRGSVFPLVRDFHLLNRLPLSDDPGEATHT